MKKSLFFIFALAIFFGVSFSFAYAAQIDTVRQEMAARMSERWQALNKTEQNRINNLRVQLSTCLSGGRCQQSRSLPRIINGEIYIPPPDLRFARGLPPIGPIGRIMPQRTGTVSPTTNFFGRMLGR